MLREQVLEAAGITDPLVLAVAYTARARSVSAVRQLREHFKDTPIFARALDSLHAAELRTAGAALTLTLMMRHKAPRCPRAWHLPASLRLSRISSSVGGRDLCDCQTKVCHGVCI